MEDVMSRYANLDALLVVRDMNDEQAGVDDILFGCALRKDDIEDFLRDVADLARREYGAMSFVELVDLDSDDEAMRSAHGRWMSDATADTIAAAERLINGE